MNSCNNCDHSIFDEQWGERKCKVYKHRIYDVDRYLDCQSHKPKNCKEEKKNANRDFKN